MQQLYGWGSNMQEYLLVGSAAGCPPGQLGTVRTRPEEGAELVEKIATAEQSLVESLRRITRQELEQGARYAVVPLFAGVVGASLRD
jgi:hypothetical protein